MFKFNIPPIDWELWSRMPEAYLWEVAAVSLDMTPGTSPGDMTGRARGDEYTRRLRLSEAHLGGELPVVSWPGKVDNRDPAYAVVRLKEFAAFARRNGFDLPSRFPVDPVNWDKWGRVDIAEVWQAVAIATGHPPDDVKFQTAEASFGKDFNEMLAVAMTCLRSSLPVHERSEVHAFSGFSDYPPTEETRNKVHMSTFREWAEGKGYTLPNRFPRVMKVSEPEQPTPAETKPTEAAPAQNPPMAQEPPSENREIGENARETLLTIIAMLAGEEKLQKAGSEARKMERKLEKRGIESPKYRMIFNHLKAAKQVLENRTVKPKP
jgi:hypothetical protein